MQVRVNDVPFPVFGSAALERTEGVHLSDVIRDLRKTLGEDKSGSGWDLPVTWGIGIMFEIVLEQAFEDENVMRPGELEQDGILMTPDGLDLDAWELLEIKATWKSTKTKPWDRWEWMAQIKAYCYALETDTCHMRVLYVVGDYKGSGPQYLDCTLTFTQQELEENWQMLVNHKNHMEARGTQGKEEEDGA